MREGIESIKPADEIKEDLNAGIAEKSKEKIDSVVEYVDKHYKVAPKKEIDEACEVSTLEQRTDFYENLVRNKAEKYVDGDTIDLVNIPEISSDTKRIPWEKGNVLVVHEKKMKAVDKLYNALGEKLGGKNFKKREATYTGNSTLLVNLKNGDKSDNTNVLTLTGRTKNGGLNLSEGRDSLIYSRCTVKEVKEAFLSTNKTLKQKLITGEIDRRGYELEYFKKHHETLARKYRREDRKVEKRDDIDKWRSERVRSNINEVMTNYAEITKLTNEARSMKFEEVDKKVEEVESISKELNNKAGSLLIRFFLDTYNSSPRKGPETAAKILKKAKEVLSDNLYEVLSLMIGDSEFFEDLKKTTGGSSGTSRRSK
jgi:uncharacterized protein YjgD (DUF1641 family)